MLDRTASWQPVDAVTPAGVRLWLAHVRRVQIYLDPALAFPIWDELQSSAATSPYQTRGWLMPWLETTGHATGVTPFIVVAFDEADTPIALLPLGLWRQGLLTVGGFLGGRDSNFNLGLFAPGVVWSASAVTSLLREAAGAAPNGIDLFVLRNQPHEWEGLANPLTMLPHQPSPSFGYKVELVRDPEAFVRQALSREHRKKLRNKVARLEAQGPVRHVVARSPETGRAIIEAFVEQRLLRCTALGIGVGDLPDLRAFLERSSIVGMERPPVELHALYCGARIVATFGGTAHRDRFCGMVMSFDADSEISKSSPGEILLERLIRSKCVEGFSIFDLGIGEARYKEAYCPDPEPLFDSLVTVSGRGRLFAAAERARLRVKREIKQTAWAWAMIRAARKTIRKLRGPAHLPR